MTHDLIMDIGMHVGNDTEFYLKKGFRVVGIEADPVLVRQVEERLSGYLATGQLTILNLAVNSFDGEATFFVNRAHDDWGTLSAEFVDRNEKIFDSKHEAIKVRCARFENILSEYGVPYYLKIDIEGVDNLCLQALLTQESRPKFISIEAELTSFDDAFNQLALLWQLGYRSFKIINQSNNHKIKCPYPPGEGVYVDQKFTGLSSGLFGEETPGPWLDIATTVERYRKILKLQSWFGGHGKYYNTILHRFYKTYLRITGQEPVGWYDFHAK
jgi:FkbM family methyltransferase